MLSNEFDNKNAKPKIKIGASIQRVNQSFELADKI
ncbi:MAG: hypothetical protein ACI8W1_000780 [Candidatus Azotimanducaceae bacterium]|jgi:hypothetical protein